LDDHDHPRQLDSGRSMKRLVILAALAALLIPASAMAFTAPLPKVPIGMVIYSSGQYEQVKPPVIGQTGDGSAFLGGRTGHYATGGPHRRANFGRLKWGTYNYNVANATGVYWVKFGPGPLVADAFRIEATAQLHFYNVYNGVFTKLTVTLHYNAHVYSPSLVGKTRTYTYSYPVEGTTDGVRSCTAPPYGHGIGNDKGAGLGSISARNMSCQAAVRAIQHGRLTAQGFLTAGFACHALKTYAEGGAIIRCTHASEAFRFTWAT
jgi:hypothetical protein